MYTVLEIRVNPKKKCSEGFEGTKIWILKFPIDSQNIFEIERRPAEKTQYLQKFT